MRHYIHQTECTLEGLHNNKKKLLRVDPAPVAVLKA